MVDIDDIDAKEAMNSIRGSRIPWVLWLVTLALAGAGFFWFRGQEEARGVERRATEGRLKEADLAVETARKAAAELSGKVERLEKENAELKAAKQQLTTTVEEQDEAIAQYKATYAQLEQKMKKEIGSGEIRLSENRGRIQVELVDKILFDSGDAHISKRGEEVLSRVGAVLSKLTDRQIQVLGHTDNAPISQKLKAEYPTNWELSTARATTVVRYLQEKASVPARLMVATGSGEFHPVASNATPLGRARNRRIELLLSPPVERVPLEQPVARAVQPTATGHRKLAQAR